MNGGAAASTRTGSLDSQQVDLADDLGAADDDDADFTHPALSFLAE
jgi:hypothetical protein